MAKPPPPTFTIPPPTSKKKKPRETPQQAAARAQATAKAKAGIRAKQGNPSDPYVTLKNGKVVATNSASALHIFGQPVTRSVLLRYWGKYNDLWLNYLGRPITAKELNHFVGLGWSNYQIVTNYLVKRPNFTKSPVWKNKYNDYADVWHQVYGENSKPDQGEIRYAIVNNLNTGAFGDLLRQRPDYTSSEEYKGNFASMSGIYTSVYGLANQHGDQLIQQAVLGGWNGDQFRTWLRQQPEWRTSDEAKGLYMNLADRFGLLPQTGGQTALSAPGAPAQTESPLVGRPSQPAAAI